MQPMTGPSISILAICKMTIKRLAEYLRDQGVPKIGRRSSSDSDHPLYMSSLRGKRVAIEVSGIIYKQNWAAVRHVVNNHPFVCLPTATGGSQWSKPSDDELLYTFKMYFASFVRRIIDSGIIPVFVLEGKSPDMKGTTVQRRSDTRSDQETKANNLRDSMDLEEYRKRLLYSYPPSYKHVDIVLDILKDKGVTVIRSRYEAEGVCAYLVNTHSVLDANGKECVFPHRCDTALCDDYDILGLYGCRTVIRNLRSTDKSHGYFEAEGYTIDDILCTIGFLQQPYSDADREIACKRFQLMCILCGSDYSDNIRGLGPSKICTMMKKHNIITYEDACLVDSRFKAVPYHDIVKTINDNMEFSVYNYD